MRPRDQLKQKGSEYKLKAQKRRHVRQNVKTLPLCDNIELNNFYCLYTQLKVIASRAGY